MAAISAACRNRISRDVGELVQNPPTGITAWIADERNIKVVEAQLQGPESTPYAGGIFLLRVTFPDRYPMEPPNVKFQTKVYHPNVSAQDGNICLSVLNMPPKGDWKPAHSLRTVLLSIQSLLAEPNPDDPLDADAAQLLKSQPKLFQSRAAEWTRTYASQDPRSGPSGAPDAPHAGAASTSAASEQPGRPSSVQTKADDSLAMGKMQPAAKENAFADGKQEQAKGAAAPLPGKRSAEEAPKPSGGRLSLKKKH